jgi:hypothetical protein
MAHPGLPRPKEQLMYKKEILSSLRDIDADPVATRRILTLETNFRNRVQNHISTLPDKDSKFKRFNTNPFVLMIHTLKRGYSNIKEIEGDILPAKEFSSMETSAGRMVEDVMLPVYGWKNVISKMHTCDSSLDGKKLEGEILKLATLKSGPRCLNDEMSENFADAIIGNAVEWATKDSVHQIHFTYGVLYGTKKLSNKKDWHILRNIREKIPESEMIVQPDQRWDCSFMKNGIHVKVKIRIGSEWWTYLGGRHCFIELCIALIRACVRPEAAKRTNNYMISDLSQIISTAEVPNNFNVGILQRSQIEWLFFIARHFCDKIR